MKTKNKIKYVFLFDYYNNHPLGIIYDWIRTKNPKDCLIVKHLSYVPYCKSGQFKLKGKFNFNNFLKILRAKLIIKYLKFMFYEQNFYIKFFKKNWYIRLN